jgi:hypothetical protein
MNGSEVTAGSLVQSPAQISLDVLIPASGDLPSAQAAVRAGLEHAQINVLDVLDSLSPADGVATVHLVHVDEEHWQHRCPGMSYR